VGHSKVCHGPAGNGLITLVREHASITALHNNLSFISNVVFIFNIMIPAGCAPYDNHIFPLFSTAPLHPMDSGSFPVALGVEMHPGGGDEEEEDSEWVALDPPMDPSAPVSPSAPIAVLFCFFGCLPDSPKKSSKHVSPLIPSPKYYLSFKQEYLPYEN